MISACGCCHPLLPKTLRQRILSKLFRTRKGDDLGATYSHYFDRERKFAAAAKITRRFSIKENIVMVGGSWTMATLIEHEIKPKSNLTISTVFNANPLTRFQELDWFYPSCSESPSFFSFVQLMQFWYLITFCWCSARKANMDSLLLQEAKGYPKVLDSSLILKCLQEVLPSFIHLVCKLSCRVLYGSFLCFVSCFLLSHHIVFLLFLRLPCCLTDPAFLLQVTALIIWVCNSSWSITWISPIAPTQIYTQFWKFLLFNIL